MTTSKSKPLSDEDRILWNRVARTVKPSRGRKMPEIYGLGEEDKPARHTRSAKPANGVDISKPETKHQPVRQHRPHTIDRPVRNKIASGRISFDARIDLHGMSQHRAHAMLLDFVHRSYANRLRHVLVITGKGSSVGSEGVLRRSVPEWFATPEFRPYVSGYSDAARHHGGAGALYVRIRRMDRGRKP